MPGVKANTRGKLDAYPFEAGQMYRYQGASGSTPGTYVKDGALVNKMGTTVDGEFQRYAVENGGYIRDNFFGPDPRLRALVAHAHDGALAELAVDLG